MRSVIKKQRTVGTRRARLRRGSHLTCTGSLRPVTQRGFTAAELAIVVAVIAILAAFGFPAFTSTLASYRLGAAARQVASDLHNAWSLARAQGRDYSVVFVPEGGPTSPSSYQVQVNTGQVGGPAYAWAPAGPVVSLPQEFAGVQIRAGGAGTPAEPGAAAIVGDVTFPGSRATFSPRGVLVGGGAVYLSRAGGGAEVYAIVVSIAGHIQLVHAPARQNPGTWAPGWDRV